MASWLTELNPLISSQKEPHLQSKPHFKIFKHKQVRQACLCQLILWKGNDVLEAIQDFMQQLLINPLDT